MWRRICRLAPGAALAFLLSACSTPQSTRPPPPPPILAGGACLADLRAKSAQFEPITFKRDGDCVIDEPVRVRGLSVRLATPATMSCGLADRIWQFDHEVVQPAARRLLGVEVVSLRHFGAYACRMETSSRHQFSQHAYGRAFDLAGFTFSDGSRIDVAKDWDDDGKRGAFLHEVAKRACGYFSVVLTPDSNDLHQNHFHLDVGPDRLCGPA